MQNSNNAVNAKSKLNEWYAYIEAARTVMASIDLDPARRVMTTLWDGEEGVHA